MNAYGVILITASILTVLYWILNIADKCVKASAKKPNGDEEAVALEEQAKKDEMEIPVKVLSFKRAMHDISNNV